MPGEEFEVDLLLDAMAYQWSPGQTLRVSVAGADWPNTIAPPAPVTLTVHGGSVELPLWPADRSEPPEFTPGSPSSSEDPEGVVWSITRDVLRRTTTASVRSGSTYDIPHGGTASEEYVGEVGVDRRTFAQWADAETTFCLTWPDRGASAWSRRCGSTSARTAMTWSSSPTPTTTRSRSATASGANTSRARTDRVWPAAGPAS